MFLVIVPNPKVSSKNKIEINVLIKILTANGNYKKKIHLNMKNLKNVSTNNSID